MENILFAVFLSAFAFYLYDELAPGCSSNFSSKIFQAAVGK